MRAFCSISLRDSGSSAATKPRQSSPAFNSEKLCSGALDAYRAGIPGDGKPFPDGAKMAKIHWIPKKMEAFLAATVPGIHVQARHTG
jgi:hypothetical protein